MSVDTYGTDVRLSIITITTPAFTLTTEDGQTIEYPASGRSEVVADLGSIEYLHIALLSMRDSFHPLTPAPIEIWQWEAKPWR